MNLSEQKTYLFNNKEELKLVSSVLQKTNSIIDESNTNHVINSYPFIDGLVLTKDVKERMAKSFSKKSRDTSSFLMSLVSVTHAKTGQKYHIISVELTEDETIGNFYINYDFLKDNFKINSGIIGYLIREKNLENILYTLSTAIKRDAQMFSNNTLSSKVEQGNLKYNIETLRSIIQQTYINYRVDDAYYIFNIDDVKFKFASDYISADNHYYSGSILLYNFQKDKFDKADRVDPFNSIIKYSVVDNVSKSQRNALADMNKSMQVVVGAGGSGKTYLCKIIAEKAIELNAILCANDAGVRAPLMYCTHSAGSLSQFLKYCSNNDLSSDGRSFTSLIYSRNLQKVKDKMQIFNNNIDKSRILKVKDFLKKTEVFGLANRLKENNDSQTKMEEYLAYIFMSRDLDNVTNYVKFLEEHKQKPSIIESILLKLGLKEEPRIVVDRDIISSLYTTDKVFASNVLNSKVQKVIDTVNNVYLKNSDVGNRFFDKMYEEKMRDSSEPYIFEGIDYLNTDITLEDVIYFLNYYPATQREKYNDYMALLRELYECIESNKAISFYKVEKLKNGRTGLKFDKDKAALFYELFPITADLVTNTTDIDVFFERVLVDEAVLVPGIFTSLILAKTNNIIALGDINQLHLDLNLPENLFNQIEKLRSTDPKPYQLTFGPDKTQMSFYNHIKRSIDEDTGLKVLVDNYRCRREIFELSMKMLNEYKPYIQRYKKINSITGDDFARHFNDTQKYYKFRDEIEVYTPFMFINYTEKRYDLLMEFLNENAIPLDDVMIVVPGVEHIAKVKQKLVNKEITVDVLKNIQGRDASVVIYDSFINEIYNAEFTGLNLQEFNLIITRTKDLFVFMGNEYVLFDVNIDGRTDEASEVVKRFFRNNDVSITKLPDN